MPGLMLLEIWAWAGKRLWTEESDLRTKNIIKIMETSTEKVQKNKLFQTEFMQLFVKYS